MDILRKALAHHRCVQVGILLMSSSRNNLRNTNIVVNRSNLYGAVLLTLLISLLVVSCRAEPETATVTVVPVPSPTLNSLLTGGRELRPTAQTNGSAAVGQTAANGEAAGSSSPAAQPTVAGLFVKGSQVQVIATPTKRPLASAAEQINSVALGTSATQLTPDDFLEVAVYDDELNENWTTDNSAGVRFDLNSTLRWYDELDPNTQLSSGAMAIALEPTADFGQLFFTVRSDSGETYHRDEILGVSFWMYSGTSIIDTGDFAVTVTGSNLQPHWSPDDGSVFFDSEDSFSETRFYDLEINRAVPPDSWIKVEIWLDDLLFDPNYEYITGIYIKNDIGFRNRIFVDRVNLIKYRGA